jgi:opacity protein-like surface antigen
VLTIAGGLVLAAGLTIPASAQQPPAGQPQARPVPTQHPLTTDFKSRFYLAAMLGYAHTNARIQDYQESVLANNWNPGVTAGVAAGFGLARFLRLEAELSYTRADLSTRRASFGRITSPGSSDALAGLVNLVWDIDVGSSFTPYVKAGIGPLYESVRGRTETINSGGRTQVDDGHLVFGYAFGAGVSRDIGPNTKLDIGYRYLGAQGQNLSRSTTPGIANPLSQLAFESHQIMAGVRYTFK